MRLVPGFVAVLLLAATANPSLPAQQPAASDSAFTRQEFMIPMRDGVKLFTVVLTPRNATVPLPIILIRTPYSAAGFNDTRGFRRVYGDMIADGYIFVEQDIRGRFRSGGTFLMNGPPHDSTDPKGVDEATDAWDTIDWLVKNLPSNNGKVGVMGISYPGWTTAMAGLHPHPALKAISPQAPLGDGWMGDDFFHQGAFRQSYGVEYSWMMEASNDMSRLPSPDRYDLYTWYLSFPSLDSLARSIGAYQWPTYKHFSEHPAYDSVWQSRSLHFSMPRTVVPTLTVGGWWDQEDVYGPQMVYRTWEPHDSAGINYIIEGPWYHGQWAGDSGLALGNLHVKTPTGIEFRRMEAKWFAHWLHGTGDGNFPDATVYDAGASEWRTFSHWPAPKAVKRSLYLLADGRAGFTRPTAQTGFDQYVSDPAHPVPYRHRPIELTYGPGSRWRHWETEDQRFVDDRPDVLTWQTEPLDSAVTVAGNIVAHLYASTTGQDADWVVKLIDVYPDSTENQPVMGGYELPIAAQILRGRYRESFSHPKPIPPNTVERYNVDLYQQMYTFQKGHRIMVQVQSTWFPLYDRNPQTWVPNIFKAPPSAYRAQTHRVYRTARYPSAVEMDVIDGG
ncbi:MAG TPA: CocE/NonD family hydrolase [Gemmatimonadales bacterium]|nr:CocE/NonD family hydrolase [Gemmatimonadales bacterium]